LNKTLFIFETCGAYLQIEVVLYARKFNATNK